MKYKKLNFADLNDLYPKSSKVSLNDFSEKDKQEYLSLYNLYRKLFTEYMMKKLNIKSYDRKIEDSEYAFSPVKKENMDAYQYVSSDELKYFYFRNNLYIEKLTKKEVDFLRKKISQGNIELDEEAEKMIEETYPKVIFEDLAQDGQKARVLFGPDSESFFADNDSVVIGVRYDEFEDENENDEEWFNRYMNQRRFLNDIINEMKEVFNKKMPQGVSIINYDATSVNQRREEEKIKSEGEER